MKKTVWLIAICLTVFALMLASPGAAPAKETGKPQYGGTLRFISWGNAMASWDFTSKWNGANESILTPAYDSLCNGDWERGPSGTGEFGFNHYYTIPDESMIGYLAESWKIESPTKIVFNVRKGVKWHNKHPTFGREFVAEDLVFAYEHVKKARWPRQAFIEKLYAPDKYTFVIEFNRPMPFWKYEVGYTPYLLVFPKETVEAGIEDWKNHSGTGPYMITNFRAGSSITFEKNPDYWGTWKHQGKKYKLPFADKLIYPLIKDDSTRLAAIQTGKIDVGTALQAKFKKRLQKGAPELNLKSIWTGPTNVISFRLDRKDLPTHDIRVRQALNMAVNRVGIRDAVYGGEAVIETRPFGDQSFLPPLKEAPEAFRMLYEYNPEKAKKLLSEAGYPNGFEIGLLWSSNEDDNALMDMIMYYWKQIGVRVKPEPLERATAFGKLSKRDYEIAMWSHDGCLTVPWSLKEADEDVWMNTSEFHDKYFHDGWEKAKQEMDPAIRVPLSKELIMYFHTQAPKICIPQTNTIQYWWPWVHNYNGEYNIGYLDAGFVRYIWGGVYFDTPTLLPFDPIQRLIIFSH
jgi:peptide/nickel transport system substrate-binding protein